jgi:hypothetical protein
METSLSLLERLAGMPTEEVSRDAAPGMDEPTRVRPRVCQGDHHAADRRLYR